MDKEEMNEIGGEQMDQKAVEPRRKRKGMEKMVCKGVREKKTKEELEAIMKAMKHYIEKKEGTEVGEKLTEVGEKLKEIDENEVSK